MDMRPKLRDTVYLTTGDDLRPRVITGILRRSGGMSYELACGADNLTWHYDFEFSREKPKVTQIRGLRNQ